MITFREIKSSDKEIIFKWRNLESVAQYMFTDHKISLEEHNNWFNKMLKDPTVKYWIIAVDDVDVGVANIFDINHTHKRCFWAFYIAE